jgi:hypothetical protein
LAEEHALLASTIHIADISMMILGIGVGIDGLSYPLDEEALKRLNMTGDDLIHLVEKILEELTKAKELINLG